MSKKVTVDRLVSINDLRKMIPIYGADITPVIQSEPGCGKSSLLSAMAVDFGDEWRRPGDEFPADKYQYIYVDCPVKDLADVGMAIPVHEDKRLEYYGNELFQLDDPRPKVIMLDEFMKSPKLLQVLWTRLMLERMVGERRLPEGSIVFATSNNQTDGVGDTMLAHAGNRVMILKMRKPNDQEWTVWATDAKIHPLLRAWVSLNPSALASYLDGNQEQNPYIFRPENRNLSFVSPRSLAKCDVILRNKALVGEDVTVAALAGTIGESAAASLGAFLTMDKDLTPPREILKNPTTATVSDRPIVLLTTLFNLVDVIEVQDDLTNAMKYIKRIKAEEIQAVFFSMVCQSQRTIKLVKTSKDITDWAAKNFPLLMN